MLQYASINLQFCNYNLFPYRVIRHHKNDIGWTSSAHVIVHIRIIRIRPHRSPKQLNKSTNQNPSKHNSSCMHFRNLYFKQVENRISILKILHETNLKIDFVSNENNCCNFVTKLVSSLARLIPGNDICSLCLQKGEWL